MVQYQDFKVTELPDSAYYIPKFVTEEEETYLLEKIYSSPKPKWKVLSNRRLQNWGGFPHPKGMIQEDLPDWLTMCIQKVSKLKVFGDKVPNHVLINEYLPGQGIMPHEDGPLFYPTIATINLRSHAVLDYYEKTNIDDQEEKHLPNNNCIGSILLERLSLLVVQDDLYHKYLHGIKEETFDKLDDNVKNLQFSEQAVGSTLERETRISLTIRHVPNFIKSKFFFKLK